MSNTEAEPLATAISAEPIADAESPGTYPMSKEGRRQAIILLLV